MASDRREYQRIYAATHRERKNAIQRRYAAEHPDQIRENNHRMAKRRKLIRVHVQRPSPSPERIAERRARKISMVDAWKLSTVEGRLWMGARRRIRNALHGIRPVATTIELIGCPKEQLRAHLEGQFREGMTWENIHIDHIRPCCAFDLSDPVQQLFPDENRKKRKSDLQLARETKGGR